MSTPRVFEGPSAAGSVPDLRSGPGGQAAIWLLCHYPDTREADERVKAACALHHALGLSVWLFGTASARYPASVERMMKEKLLAAGVPSESVMCSTDSGEAVDSLDTVQEAANAFTMASRRGITTLICVSNRLQLLQVRGLLRKKPVQLVFVPIPLRDRRWWYVMIRLVLIPLAFLGMGQRFLPFVLTRRARATLAAWPF